MSLQLNAFVVRTAVVIVDTLVVAFVMINSVGDAAANGVCMMVAGKFITIPPTIATFRTEAAIATSTPKMQVMCCGSCISCSFVSSCHLFTF